jgi:hypothetical protein
MLQQMSPHIRSKFERAFKASDTAEKQARAKAFGVLLCDMLNNPNESVAEQPDTRYSYEEGRPNLSDVPPFPDSKGRYLLVDFPNETPKGVAFKVQRYAGVVESSEFAKVQVWAEDAERLRPALVKTLYSMVDEDKPPDPSVDFRPKGPQPE